MNKPASTYRVQFHKNFNFRSLKKIIPYLVDLGIDTLYASPIFEAVPGSTHGYDVVNPLAINPEIGTEKELFSISKKLKKAGISWLQDIVPNHMAFHPENKWLMDVLKNGKNSKFASFFDIDFNQADGRLMVPFLGQGLETSIKEKNIRLKEMHKAFFISTGGSDWPVNEETAQRLLNENLKERNEDPEFLTQIAASQHYRLCNWQETNSQINYRRFFTVNSLICLNIQDAHVFDTYHKYIFELVNKGVFQGLRIDHVDGLYDPKGYTDRLRNVVGKNCYIVVEKILETNEQLPAEWAVQGTTGYDFLAMVNNLFTNVDAEKSFDTTYENFIGKPLIPEELIQQKKQSILFKHMQGELNNLYTLFKGYNFVDDAEIDSKNLKTALGAFMIQMPVYRYYSYNFPLTGKDLERVNELLQPVIKQEKTAAAGQLLYKAFIGNPPVATQNYNENLSMFFRRCMQFTGPLMAKGVEDTFMFTYNRFIGHTEVGDAAEAFGLSTAAFHDKMLSRQQLWPLSMNGSATHDTKKGEDVRARLNVLSDVPEQWSEFVSQIQQAIEEIQEAYPKLKSLHKNDSYLILQVIIGALPFAGEDEDEISNRLEKFIQKALREAKKRSDWAEPDEAYEQDMNAFTQALLDKKNSSSDQINAFLKQIADFSVVNSLAQQLLKFTCPGVPDVYQGSEMWDLSLVDPDNRRPVDYKKRVKGLKAIKKNNEIQHLFANRFSGNIKLWITQKLFKIRKKEKELFENGVYIPLEIKGKYSAHIFAFARQLNEKWIITVVPLGLARLAEIQHSTPETMDWADTQLILPHGAPLSWQDLFNEEIAHSDIPADGIRISQLFNGLPIALIKLFSKTNNRSAGILMHITSLPSDFGIGDLGDKAFNFINFLHNARQKYWQILPVNPTKAENGHSPYSCNSATAGNILLISPHSLHNEGLLSDNDLKAAQIPEEAHVDFKKAEPVKHDLLKKAYLNYIKINSENGLEKFNAFCEAENNWLDHFSLYTALKKHLKNLEWYNWPDKFKFREPKALSDFKAAFQEEIDEIKWQQFIFFSQWRQLKAFANQKGIQIIGDLPFYLDYDAVEVWSSPEYFLLDEKLNKVMVAGVPPDYFNEKGQLWGMPVFNWKFMKQDKYAWWINRLKKNMEMYDLLRLDHFRAFASYWQVPAQNTDAIHGNWALGAGAHLFKKIKSHFDELPFIAEDLGEIDSKVEALIQRFNLPGMKILQFAFNEHLAVSTHIPHNFQSPNCVVYSGTHDNNTVKGWFRKETDAITHERIEAYTGIEASEKNINDIIIRLCYASTASLAILPVQDILDMDETARMNVPGTSTDNWTWKLTNGLLNEQVSEWLGRLTELYGRNQQ